MSSATATDAMDAHSVSLLSDEERAAINSEVDPADAAALAKLAEGADDPDDADDGEVDEVLDADGNPVATTTTVEPAAAAAAAPAAAPAAEPAAPAAAAAEATPAPAAAPAADTPLAYRAELPADYQQRVDALTTNQDELVAKFEAGDIDAREYRAKSDELNKERSDLDSLRMRAEISADMVSQANQRMWAQASARLADKVLKDDGFDYRTDDEKREKLNTIIKVLAADDKNLEGGADDLLARAHTIAKATYGFGKAPAAAAAAPPAKTPEKPDRSMPASAVPKTLAQVPGGDGPGDLAGEFADVDALDGEELEAAIAAMSPARRAKYQAGL